MYNYNSYCSQNSFFTVIVRKLHTRIMFKPDFTLKRLLTVYIYDVVNSECNVIICSTCSSDLEEIVLKARSLTFGVLGPHSHRFSAVGCVLVTFLKRMKLLFKFLVVYRLKVIMPFHENKNIPFYV